MTTRALSALYTPVRIGSMELRNRVMVATHAMADGNLLGTQAEADRFIGYYRSKAEGGAAWVCGSSMHIRTPVPVGFEPSGMGASLAGNYRHPLYVERAGQFAAGLHSANAMASMQMILMGGRRTVRAKSRTASSTTSFRIRFRRPRSANWWLSMPGRPNR